MDFINQKTNKQKVLNFVLTLDTSWRAKNAPKHFFKVLELHNMQSQTIFELYIDDNKAILRTFLNLQRNFMKSFTPSKLPQLLLLNF